MFADAYRVWSMLIVKYRTREREGKFSVARDREHVTINYKLQSENSLLEIIVLIKSINLSFLLAINFYNADLDYTEILM